MVDAPDETPGNLVSKRVAQYIQLREKLKLLDEAHKKQTEPILTAMNLIQGRIEQLLDQCGADNMKTKHGTCYKSTKWTASLADPELFMKFVKDNDRFDLIDRKANANAIRDYVQERKVLPPGVNLSQVRTIGIRK